MTDRRAGRWSTPPKNDAAIAGFTYTPWHTELSTDTFRKQVETCWRDKAAAFRQLTDPVTHTGNKERESQVTSELGSADNIISCWIPVGKTNLYAIYFHGKGKQFAFL